MAYYQDMSRSRYDQGVDSKIVVMGNSGTLFRILRYFFTTLIPGVGKTSLLHRYTQNKFDPKNTTSTSGAFFVTKKVSVQGLKVRLQLWDTAGQERFRSMVSFYAKRVVALLINQLTNFTRPPCIIEVCPRSSKLISC